MARDLKQVNATGDVVTGPAFLRSVVLTPGTAVSSVAIRDGSGGAVRLTLTAVANGDAVPWTAGSKEGVPFATSIHATVAGTGALVSFEYD